MKKQAKTQQQKAIDLLKSNKKVSKSTLEKFTESPSGLIRKLRVKGYNIQTVEGGYKADSKRFSPKKVHA